MITSDAEESEDSVRDGDKLWNLTLLGGRGVVGRPAGEMGGTAWNARP
ncbi:hypothetical protein ACFYW9_27480 [Streptomyces sp. NPDC002698]